MTDFIRQLKSQINITEVVGEYVRLKKTGSNHMGLCPFHAERSPSFSVSEKKGIFHCFGCQKNGDVITFIQEIQTVSFHEAVRILCQKYGFKVPPEFSSGKKSTNEHREAPVSEILFKLNRFVAQFYHQNLLGPQGAKAREYLYDRGISDQTIKQAYLGYATPGWADLYDFLKSKQAPLDKAEELGLIRKKSTGADQSGRAHYDLFRDRVIFPVIDNKERVVAFGARALGSAEGPKYLNSSDSVIFKKGSQLYGVFTAQKEIRAEDICVVVEGFMDCLTLQQNGIGFAVATLGTALTEEHIIWLKRMTTNIVVLFDGDSAGQEAQHRAMELFLKAGIVARGVQLPDELDPDEYLKKHGGDALKSMIQKAPFLLDQFILDLASKSGSHQESRVQAVNTLMPLISLIRSETAKQMRIQELSSLFQVPLSSILPKAAAPAPAASPKPAQFLPQRQARTSPPKRDQLDTEFVSKLILTPSFLNQIEDFEAVLRGIDSQEIAAFLNKLLEDLLNQTQAGNHELAFEPSILDYTTNPTLKTIVSKALIEQENLASGALSKEAEEIKHKELKDLENKLVRKGFEKRRNYLRTVLLKADTSGNSIEFSKLMQEYNSLIKDLDEKKSTPTK